MSTKALSRTTATVLSIVLIALANSTLASGKHGHGSESSHEGDHSFTFGAPASPSEADRTVEVEANDQMEFAPGEISVKKGETVRFVIKNVGQVQHSFTLATPGEQQEHEKEMQGMPMDRMANHMDDDPNGVVAQSGKTESMTWRFTKSVAVEFACHIPGHYDAGMKGRIRIK